MIDGISCQLDFDYHQIKQDVCWSIVNENGLILWKNKIIWRLPKNKVITLSDIEAKLNQKEQHKKPLVSVINGLTYATNYGFGYACLFASDDVFQQDVAQIKKQLTEQGYQFKTEFSDARYVLRFIITKG